MITGNGSALLVLPYATTASNATASMVFDTKGFDYANIVVGMNTHATNKATLNALKITESDTSTVISSQSAIVAFTGGTATSSSVGFVIPTAVKMGPGAAVEFQVDLKKRKRYLGLQITPGDSTAAGRFAVCKLERPEYSRDTAAEKYVQDAANTSSTQCALVVSG